MNLIGTKTIPSKVDASVTYTVKALNVVQRAQRDEPILKGRAAYNRALRAKLAVVEAVCGPNIEDRQPDDETRQKYREQRWDRFVQTRDFEQMCQFEEHAAAELNVFHAVLLPATLRAALVKIEGLTIEGEKIETVDAFLASPSDLLLNEAYVLCEDASGLTGENQKN